MGKQILRLGGCALLAFLIAGQARDKVAPVNQDRAGLALQGYDPVAYFQAGQPARGDAKFSHTWMEATWRFRLAEHRDLFMATPEKYAPQFGGYCAWAVSNGYTAKIDPEAWRIVDGKLYLNYNKEVQQMWQKDVAQRIEAGNRNWPTLRK